MLQKTGVIHAAVKAVFFDIGRTLRVTRHREGHDLEKIKEMMGLLGENAPVDSFIEKLHVREKSYRIWGKHNFIELNEEELLTRFLLPDYPPDFVRANAITLNQLWRDSEPKYILPDMVDTMHTLAARGYKLGLISNTSSSVDAHLMLAEQGLTDLFSSVVLSAPFGRRKPHPSLFVEAARLAGVHPWECAYVGDSPSRDLVGPLQAGFGCIILIHTDGYNLDEFDQVDFIPEKDARLILKPDYSIGRLSELLDIFPKVRASETSYVHSNADSVYDVALSTMWGVDQKIPFEETFLAANRIGIHRFELNHRVTTATFEQFDHDHHYISTVHDPCRAFCTYDEQKQQDLLLSSLDEEKRKTGVQIACHTIDLACQLGARSVVLHPGSIVCDRSLDNQLRNLYAHGNKGTLEFEQLKAKMVAHRASLVDAHKTQALKSLQEIAQYNTGIKGVLLGLENRYRFYDMPLPDELEEMLAIFDGNAFGFQYDIGHATALDELGLTRHTDWLERFGSRIVGAHIHDVIGITDHQVPGFGSVNYGKIVPYLPANCIKTLEIRPQASIEQIAAGLDILTSIGMIDQL